MTTSPALKYGSKGWEDKKPTQTAIVDGPCEEKQADKDGIEWHRMADWRRFSSNLDVDPAEILKRVL